MSFQIKKFNSIVASMINWVSSATDRITDFNVGSVSRTILEAVAIELEEIYYQLLRAVEEAIEEAIYRTFNFPRNPAQKATGNVRFYRLAGTEPEITINRGTMVGTDTDPVIYFETQADDSIPALTGYATGGSNLELIDYSKNWVTEGVHIGSRVKNITDSGETLTAGVLSISSTAPGTDNTLNFSALTNGASFSLPVIDDYPLGCRFDKVYYDDAGVITDYTTNSGAIDTNYVPVGLVGGEDYLYLGHSDPFFGFQSAIGAGTPQAVTADMVVEFWNGSSWASIDNLVDGTTLPAPSKPFSIIGIASWDYPTSWAKVAYNGFYYYWVRISSATTLTAGAQVDRLQYRKGNEYKVIVLYEDVAVQAIVSGIGGNVAGGAIDVLISSVSNINSITNPAAFNDGGDEETDLERKDRFALYIQSLARATKGALEYAARTVEQVVAAKAVDDIRPWVYVLDYDPATPIYTDITSAMRNPGDAAVDLLPSAEASGDALYIGADEPFSWLNMHLVTAGICIDPTKATWQYYNGTTFTPIVTGLIDGTNSGTGTLTQSGTISFTIPTDWVASTLVVSPTVSKLKMWIRLGITGNAYSVTPTGDWCSLPPGFGYVYLYIHDGSGDANATLITAVENAVELYRGCGIIVEVKAPVRIQPAIAVTLLVASNYDPNDVADDVEQGIIDWMNTFVLGQDFYLAELYQQVMDMNDKAIINATATINGSDNDIIVPSASVIRPNPLTVVVTGISI